MPEGDDYEPVREHNFAREKEKAEKHRIESFAQAKAEKKVVSDLIPKSVTFTCKWPLMLFSDVSGSVGIWPGKFREKYPYLEHETYIYMGRDTETCFGAIGDPYSLKSDGSSGCDTYFTQIRPPAKGRENAIKTLAELVIEGGGGSGYREAYELAAAYALYNVFFPKARRKPLLVIMGDEAPYEKITRKAAALIGVTLPEAEMSTRKIFKLLKEKCTVYMARKPYGSYEEHEIHYEWVRLLGDNRVCVMKSPERIVDILLGIMAKESGKIPLFFEDITKRQTAEQCKEIIEALEPVFADETPDDAPIEAESNEGIQTKPLA
jgi:hypothetical protein